MRITELLNAICADFESQTDNQVSCTLREGPIDPSELGLVAAQTPAMYLTLRGNPQMQNPATGEIDADLSLLAYIVTADTVEKNRMEAALDLVETLLVRILDQRWGQTGLLEARDVHSKNLYSAETVNNNIALWEISWQQAIRLGPSTWESTGTKPTEFHVGMAPEIGLGHETDYVLIEVGNE